MSDSMTPSVLKVHLLRPLPADDLEAGLGKVAHLGASAGQPFQASQLGQPSLLGPRASCRASTQEVDWLTQVAHWNLIFQTCCCPTVSRSSVSPLPYRPLDLRWRLFQGNSSTLIRNRPELMDGRKLAPASRSEGVILNYSDLLGGEQVRGGFRGLPSSKTCGRVPEQSKTDTSSAIHPATASTLYSEMDGEPSGRRNLLGAGQINLQSGV